VEKDRIIQRLWALVIKGEQAQRATDEASQYPNSQKNRAAESIYVEWRLSSLSFVENLVGTESRYFAALANTSEDFEHLPLMVSNISRGLASLRALREEVEFGPVVGIEGLVSAEIFDDFLEMAEHLWQQHYVAVVPSLVGAVLEDGLKRIARRRSVTVKEEDSIAGLNSRLFDAKAYSVLVRKKNEVWNTIRNNADHGKFDLNSNHDVEHMPEGVRDFLAAYLK